MQTYDDPDALVSAQDQMRRVTLRYAIVCLVVIALGAPLALSMGATPWVPLALCLILSAIAMLSIRRLGRLQRRLWRVAVSARHVTLLTVSRRQRTLGWRAITRVDVSDAGIVVVAGRDDGSEVRVLISSSFASYVDLAHHVVALAERWGRPIWIGGQPLARLDVRTLVASLRPDLSAGATD